MRKTNQRVQMLGLVLCTASAAHAQSQPTSGGQPTPPPSQESALSAPAPAPPAPAPVAEPPMPTFVGPQQLGPAEYALPRGPSTYQGSFMFGINWELAIPLGSVHSFTGNVSPVGFDLYGQYWVTSRVTLGASLDWQTYWETQPRTTYPVENGAVTATADNSVQNGAARFLARFYAIEHGPVLPYGGVNIGVGWSTFQSAAADLALYDNTVSVLLGGEVGAVFVPSPGAPLLSLGMRYTNLPAADFLRVTNVQSLAFQFGILSP